MSTDESKIPEGRTADDVEPKETSRPPDQRMQYDELLRQQPNTVRSEPGSAPYELAREGTPTGTAPLRREGAPSPEPQREGENQFRREGARLHGDADDRDKGEGHRDRAWVPDDYKAIDVD